MEKHSFEGESPNGNLAKDPIDNPPGPSKPLADPSSDSKDQANESIPPLSRITNDEDDKSPPAYVRRYMPQEQKDNFEDLESPPPEPVQEPHDSRSDPEFQQQANNKRERRETQKSVQGPCGLRPGPPRFAPPPVPERYPDPDIGQQTTNEPDPGQQAAPAVSVTWDRCVSFYRQINAFTFQFPFHTLLLTWPTATAIMGALNLKYCRINNYLPYLMMAVGLLGTAAVLQRLYVIYYEERVTLVRAMNFWIWVRAAEFIIWGFFAIQMYYFFEHTPSFIPGEKRYCKPKIYKINCGLMFLTAATMIGWIVVNVGNFVYWFPRRHELPIIWFI